MNLSGISPLISAAAFILSAAVVVIKLRHVRRDRFVAITNGLFQIWQSPDFMKAQLWLIYDLKERSWEDIRARHGGQDGEAAFLRVTGFYNRVGTLINLRLVDERAILRTIGWTACAVWNSTYLGGNMEDRLSAIRLDGDGDMYVAGQTRSHDYPDEERFSIEVRRWVL